LGETGPHYPDGLISGTSRKLSNCCQQVTSEQEPLTPWHLQVALVLRMTAYKEGMESVRTWPDPAPGPGVSPFCRPRYCAGSSVCGPGHATPSGSFSPF